MALIPLLPKTQGQEWPPQTVEGLHSVSNVDYQRNLCESYFEASDFGTPSPLAYSMVVGDRLERFAKEARIGTPNPRFADVFEHWCLLVQGLYFDLVEARSVALKSAGGLGLLLSQEAGGESELSLLTFRGATLGLTDPRVAVVPGVRVTSEVFRQLREAVAEKTTAGAAEYFARWARREAQDHTCLATELLAILGRRWAGTELAALEDGQKDLFDPGLTVAVGDPSGADLDSLQMVVYRGTPISCSHCGYEISREAPASAAPYPVRSPDDCRCSECLTPQGWLEDHKEWIRYDDELRRFLIYAFRDSPCQRPGYPVELEMQEDGVVLRTGRFAMKVIGMVLSEDRLKCDRLTFFRDGDREIRPSLPVRGEFFDLVEVAGKGARMVPPGNYGVPLRIRGWQKEVKLSYAPDEIHREEALVLVWPDFRLQGWESYFYLVDAEEPMRRAGLGVSLLRKGETPEVRREDRGKVAEAFDAVEMVFLGDGTQEPEHAGIFCPDWRSLDRGNTPVTLALDFGTSATVLWYQVGEDHRRPLMFEDLTQTVIPHEELSQEVLAESRWLPTYNPGGTAQAGTAGREESKPNGDDASPSWFLPSEIVVSNGHGSGLGWTPIRDFRLLHPRATRPQGEVLYNIKSEPPQETNDGRFRFSELVSNYLEMVLLLSLASVLKELPRTGYFKLRFAFPRAFSDEKLGRYVEAFGEALERVRESTGLRCNDHCFLDEAQAAAHAIQARGDAALVLDMGGGTTDICIFEWKKGVLEPVLLDSLQYGGSDFLNLLVTHKHLFPNPALEGEDPRLWLIREVRLHGFGSVVRRYYTAEQTAKQQTAKLLTRFFDPVVFFVRRLFDSLAEQGRPELAKGSLSVYLMGNGWSLADAISAVDSGQGRNYSQVLERLLMNRGFQASVLTKPDGVEGWTGPKAAVAYGALKAPENVLLRTAEAAGGDGGIRSILGFDLEIDDGSNNRTKADWHAPVPLALAGSTCAPLLSGITLPEEWSFVDFSQPEVIRRLEEICSRDVEKVGNHRLKRSVLARFVENVYLRSLGQAGAEQF